jgi:hypothetical protein
MCFYLGENTGKFISYLTEPGGSMPGYRLVKGRITNL